MGFEAEMSLLWGEAVIFTDSCLPLASAESRRILLAPCSHVQTRAQGLGDKLP